MITSSCHFRLPKPSDWSSPGRGPTAPWRSSIARRPTKGQLEWVDEPGTDARGIDLSAVGALAEAVSHLETVRFLQYDGEIQPYTGLIHPRLTVAVKLGANEPDRIIRVGHAASPGLIYAAEGMSLNGPVFLLPAGSWDALIKSGQRLPPFPDDVFAPPSKSIPR